MSPGVVVPIATDKSLRSAQQIVMAFVNVATAFEQIFSWPSVFVVKRKRILQDCAFKGGDFWR